MKYAKNLLTLGLALGAVGLVSCSTPKPECQAAASNVNGAGLSGLAAFAVRLVPVSGTGPCAELQGEVIGMQTYHPATEESVVDTGVACLNASECEEGEVCTNVDPSAPADTTCVRYNSPVRDLSKTSIALRTQSHGELTWMNEDFGFPTDTDVPNAIGDFTSIEPDGSEFCQVPTVSEARVVFPGAEVPIDTEEACTTDADCAAGPGGTCTPLDPMDPMAGSTCVVLDIYEPTDLAYRWSNMSFYVTAAATGTQFTADLEVVLNGCTATYKAIGMWPAVDCTGITGFVKVDTGFPCTEDVDCDPEVDPDAPGGTCEPSGTCFVEQPTFGPLDEYCHPEADPKHAINPRPYGSGINPDFGPVTCDANFGPVPIVNQYYGGGLSIPRCAIAGDTVPALEGFEPLTPAE